MSDIRDWQAAMDQPIEPASEAKRHAAALTVAGHALGADDARELLAMLGLVDA